MGTDMSRHVIKKGMAYFKRNGFKKACRRTVYFFTEKNSYKMLLKKLAPTEEELERQRNEKFPYMPKVSIIIPMYDTPIRFFRELVECVQAQSYSNWELCLADGTGRDTESGAFARLCANDDKRIVYRLLESNEGISGNTNRALELATGDFVALMDHDDLITRDALYYLVKAVNDDPLADSVYSDEDKMDMEGGRLFEPHFKPDFNIDYLRGCNYICHMFMTRTSIAREIGGFRSEYDGAQDFDFIFRCSEKSRHVAHVPRVIYHWRCHVNSTAAVPESKLYAYDAGVASITGHMERLGLPMKAAMGHSFGYYSVVSQNQERPGVVAVVHGDGDERRRVKDRLSNLTYPIRQWINCDDTPAAINAAVDSAASDYVLLVDSRVDGVSDDAVESLLGYAIRQDVVGAGARVLDRTEKVYHTFFIMGIKRGSVGQAFRELDADNTGYYMRAIMPQDVSGVGMYFMLIKRSAWEQAGGLNEDQPLLYGSADLCLRIRGLKNGVDKENPGDVNAMTQDGAKFVYVPQAVAHIDDIADDREHSDLEEKAFAERWRGLAKHTDMYYNVNLTRRDTNFATLSSMELKGEDL
jgi:glycosyltransferase involved in cell wall biosynthesis